MSQAQPQTSTTYSRRSQRSMIQETILKKQLNKIAATIRRFEEKIPGLEESKAFLTNRVVVHDEHTMQPRLDEKLMEIANVHGVIKSCEEERERTEQAIRKLDPGSVEVQARLAQQGKLAELVEKRLDKDRKIDELLAELRQVLHERADSTAEMANPATALELTMPKTDLDTRLEKLAASLPEDVFTASEKSHLWFLGKQKATKAYIVVDEHLLRPETLAHNGIFHFGDIIQLIDEEARELLRRDRPATKRRQVWTYAPPSVMSLQAFEAMTKEAQQKGIPVETINFWKNVQLDAAAENQYKVEGRMSPAAVEPIADFESTMKIKGRVKRRILAELYPGIASARQYEPGEIIELMGKPFAWGLVESGAIGPP